MGSSILRICRNWKVYQSNEKKLEWHEETELEWHEKKISKEKSRKTKFSLSHFL
jgi:hypothetical protein